MGKTIKTAAVVGNEFVIIMTEFGNDYKVKGIVKEGMYRYDGQEFETFKELGEYLCSTN